MGSVLTEENKKFIQNHLGSLFRLWNEMKDTLEITSQPHAVWDTNEAWCKDIDQWNAVQHAKEVLKEMGQIGLQLYQYLNSLTPP
jgi:hypothetical protein